MSVLASFKCKSSQMPGGKSHLQFCNVQFLTAFFLRCGGMRRLLCVIYRGKITSLAINPTRSNRGGTHLVPSHWTESCIWVFYHSSTHFHDDVDLGHTTAGILIF